MFSRVFRVRVQYSLASRLNELAPAHVTQTLPNYWSGDLADQYQVFLKACRKAGVNARDTAAVIAAWIFEIASLNDEDEMAAACLSIARATAKEILETRDARRGPAAKLITQIVAKSMEGEAR
ncbi:MAG: hypothetical protein WEF50_12205 [Myxococcota bacterium]